MRKLCVIGAVTSFVAACGGGAGGHVVEAPAVVGINAAERYDARVGAALAKQWRAGDLRLRESNVFVVEGRLDDAAMSLLELLGGRVVGPEITDEWIPAVSIELPNEALPFVLPQSWLSRVEIEPSSRASAWVARPVDMSRVPGEVQSKIDPMLLHMLATSAHQYTFSGTITLAGCVDDARRAELVATGVDSGLVRSDAACSESRVSIIAPVAVAPTVAAMPWVREVALEAEPKADAL